MSWEIPAERWNFTLILGAAFKLQPAFERLEDANGNYFVVSYDLLEKQSSKDSDDITFQSTDFKMK